ncbi:hypothetical protein PoB_000665900 [Plakobranchus ocellatus]|uniref:Uncharacterized protein n=1 Tax=Plakobranchus ocellatus TaxID=259542 RepID=A0AAV3YDK0_9GAST|nr:hypothetical protein PoB_000665900 [Plakobranchus ocellatus]
MKFPQKWRTTKGRSLLRRFHSHVLPEVMFGGKQVCSQAATNEKDQLNEPSQRATKTEKENEVKLLDQDLQLRYSNSAIKVDLKRVNKPDITRK